MSSRTLTGPLSGAPNDIRFPQRGQWTTLGGSSGIGKAAPQPHWTDRCPMGLLYRSSVFLFGSLQNCAAGLLLEIGISRERGEQIGIASVERRFRLENP